MLNPAVIRAVVPVAGILLTVTACGTGSPASASSAPSSSPPPAAVTGQNPLAPLVALSLSRINTADAVSAAKFGTSAPIDDPARERQVYTGVSAKAQAMLVDPDEATRFFRDQIEANKVVQRGLYQQWTTHPEHRPGTRPDLAKDVRPELDRLTGQIMDSLKATTSARHDGAHCATELQQATKAAGHDLDQLHQQALTVATASICAG